MPPSFDKLSTRWLCVLAVLLAGTTSCDPIDAFQVQLDRVAPYNDVDPEFAPEEVEPVNGLPYRTIDGTNNHSTHFHLGAARTPLRRLMASDYPDGIGGIGQMAGQDRPGARIISNVVCADTQSAVNTLGASDYLWQWGQFLDHDMDLTETNPPFVPEHIRPETGDPWFDPESTGLSQIDFFRSKKLGGTGTSQEYPRQQRNEITHFIDASNVYGSDDERAAALRTNDGTGMLKTSAGDLLPFNVDGLDNAGGTGPELFLAGDIRANEQVALAAMHTLFVREHNRLAQEIATADPLLTGEEIYQEARQFVGGLMQAITYNEFLPALLGPDALEPYDRYNLFESPAIFNSFSTAAYRFGHSALSSTLLRRDENLLEIPFGDLPLRNAFFAPQRLINEGGIDPILRGLALQPMRRVDTEVVDDVRNFLFGPPGAGGFDLCALNIQRGRDHGLPSYLAARIAWQLPYPASFADVSSDPNTQARLASVYDDVADIDLWVGILAEDPHNGGHVGRLAFELITTQFENVRDGDYYWYEWFMDPAKVAELNSTTLADVIRRNTGIGSELPDDVFQVP